MGEKPGIDLARRIGVVRLSEKARLPTKSSGGAAGLDLYPAETVLVPPLQTRLVHTDLAVQLPPSSYGLICNKSKISIRGISVITGVIDGDYTGPILIQVYNRNMNQAMTIGEGLPLAQLIVQPFVATILEEQDYLTPTARGWNAFGSTDFKNRGNYKMAYEKPTTSPKPQ
jgi:dUTP pyrophosphatase